MPPRGRESLQVLPGLPGNLRRAVSDVLRRPMPLPAAWLRRGPFRAFGVRRGLHEPRTAAALGCLTGLAIVICLATGVISHLHQHPPAWFAIPSRPVWGYQVTQGLHVATGIALVPLVLAKLWVVYPRLFAWPPVRTLGHALERVLVVPLVAGTLFQLTTGLANIVQWYPWEFYFPATHWAVAWVVVGALLVHVALKLPVPGVPPRTPPGPSTPADVPNRRALLLAVAAATGTVTVATVGQTIAPLSAVSLLAPRRPRSGPQGVPVNRTARAAGVIGRATDPAWRLHVRTSANPASSVLALSLPDLAAMPQHAAWLPIACVEGWSTGAIWSGVRLKDVLDAARISPGSHVRAVSLETAGLYRTSPIGPSAARDPLTLLALQVNGHPLDLDHGFPLRLIAANRPGVQQTKWLSAIEVVDR